MPHSDLVPMGSGMGRRSHITFQKGKNMNEIVRKISLDLSRKSNINLIFSSQTDMNSRVFLISLFDDGRPYLISSETSAAVNVKRSDGSSGAFIAEITEDGRVKYTAGSWALGVAGLTNFSVSLYNGNAQKLTSSSFTVDIAPGLYLGLEVGEDNEEQNIYDSMMNKFSESIAKAEKAQKSAEKGAEDAMYAVQCADEYAREAERHAQNAYDRAYDTNTHAHDAWDFREQARGYAEEAHSHSETAARSEIEAQYHLDAVEGYAEKAEVSEDNARASATVASEAATSAIAAATAQAPGIVNSVSGELISVRDSADRPAAAFKVIGKTHQDGTPTPDAPVAINCVKAGTKIKICGKNLLDIDSVSTITYFPSTGETRKAHAATFSGSGTYTVSARAKAGAGPDYIYVMVLGEDDCWKRSFTVITGAGATPWTCTLADGERLVVYNAYDYIAQNLDVTKEKLIDREVQVEVGSEHTRYEPYVSGGEIVLPCDLYEGDIWYPVSGEVERSDGSSEQYEAQAVSLIHSAASILQEPVELLANLELEYVADTKIYIDNRLAELQAMILEG